MVLYSAFPHSPCPFPREGGELFGIKGYQYGFAALIPFNAVKTARSRADTPRYIDAEIRI